VVPRLRFGGPNFELRFEKTRVIKTRSGDAVSCVGDAAEEPRTAVGAKPALVNTHGFAQRCVVTGRTFCDLDRLCRHIDNSGVGPATRALTIATVTIEHRDRFGIDFVTNRAAFASAGKRFGHMIKDGQI